MILYYHISLAYAATLFVCLAVACKNPQMVHDSGVMVNGYFSITSCVS